MNVNFNPVQCWKCWPQLMNFWLHMWLLIGHQLLKSIDINRLICIDCYQSIDYFPMIDFHWLDRPGVLRSFPNSVSLKHLKHLAFTYYMIMQWWRNKCIKIMYKPNPKASPPPPPPPHTHTPHPFLPTDNPWALYVSVNGWSFLLWGIRMFPCKSLFKICRLLVYWPTKLKFCPSFHHL